MTDHDQHRANAQRFAEWFERRRDARQCDCTDLVRALGYAARGEPVPHCPEHDPPTDDSDPAEQLRNLIDKEDHK